MAFGDFTVTRASTKNVLGSAGLYVSVANDTPAFEFNTDGSYRGLLVEPGATNLALQSQAFNEAVWTKTASTVTANTSVSPDGATTGDKLVEDLTTASHIVSQSFTPVNATTYTASVFLKASERSFAFLGFSGGSMATTFISVNLSTGAVTTGTGTPLATSTQSVGNGWYRVSISLTSTGTTGSNVEIRTSTDGVWANRSYLGDGTSGIFIWQAQVETGSVATSPIVTTAGTASRVADVVSLTGASSLIGQTEGTIAVAFETRPIATTKAVINLSDGTGRGIATNASGDLRFRTQTIKSAPLVGVIGVAVSYTNSMANWQASVDGSELVASSTTAVGTLTAIGLGLRIPNNDDQLNGWLKAVALFPQSSSVSVINQLSLSLSQL
jgi:hypothetical protein